MHAASLWSDLCLLAACSESGGAQGHGDVGTTFECFHAGFFVCKLKKVANGRKEQAGGEDDVPSDMEGAEDSLTAEEDAPRKAAASKAGRAGGRRQGKRKAPGADAGESSQSGSCRLYPLTPHPVTRCRQA